jgi:HAMP domain-containing protein
VWLALFVGGVAAKVVLDRAVADSGCFGTLAFVVACTAATVLAWRVLVYAFRAIVRKTTLRLAFSYFLIGIVPIPLLAALLFLGSYIVANQFVANRLRREVTAIGETAAAERRDLPEVRVNAQGLVEASDLSQPKPGDKAPWVEGLARPGFLALGGRVWLAAPRSRNAALLLDLSDPSAPWLAQLADRTGYEVSIALQQARSDKRGLHISTSEQTKAPGMQVDMAAGGPAPVRPRGAEKPGKGVWRGEWIRAYYLETVLNAVEENAETGGNVAVLQATTSPHILFDQLFTQGVAEIGRVFQVAFVGVAAALLLVYLAALAIAFVLAGSIARNINRLTRATRAMAGGDFSVRIQSRSRDQIGDLTRSFDGMAVSMEKLLADTARKERLESELAIARTIQHKLLPPTSASLPGFSVLAHFEPVAEIGGDYYDYLPMPDGRTAVALGDVSGHGLPTGLLVAMAKAGLSTLIEAGHEDGELFARLNELIHRSTDPRHYMTLALLAYDARLRRGVLTNAGQLAPYRIAAGRVEALSLPSFPLGLFPERTFPAREFSFTQGDLVVLLTDGLVEAADANDDPFGFERLEAVLRSSWSGGAAGLKDAILSAVRAHCGDRAPDDDCTLLILALD